MSDLMPFNPERDRLLDALELTIDQRDRAMRALRYIRMEAETWEADEPDWKFANRLIHAADGVLDEDWARAVLDG